MRLSYCCKLVTARIEGGAYLAVVEAPLLHRSNNKQCLGRLRVLDCLSPARGTSIALTELVVVQHRFSALCDGEISAWNRGLITYSNHN
jgi:hypothetical protein